MGQEGARVRGWGAVHLALWSSPVYQVPSEAPTALPFQKGKTKTFSVQERTVKATVPTTLPGPPGDTLHSKGRPLCLSFRFQLGEEFLWTDILSV